LNPKSLDLEEQICIRDVTCTDQTENTLKLEDVDHGPFKNNICGQMEQPGKNQRKKTLLMITDNMDKQTCGYQ
jgi:hypothetical protein